MQRTKLFRLPRSHKIFPLWFTNLRDNGLDVNLSRVGKLKSSDIEWADMIFATAMLVQKESLRGVVKRCKERGKRVVIGGPYVQNCCFCFFTSQQHSLSPRDRIGWDTLMPIAIGQKLESDFRGPLGLLSDCHRASSAFLMR